MGSTKSPLHEAIGELQTTKKGVPFGKGAMVRFFAKNGSQLTVHSITTPRDLLANTGAHRVLVLCPLQKRAGRRQLEINTKRLKNVAGAVFLSNAYKYGTVYHRNVAPLRLKLDSDPESHCTRIVAQKSGRYVWFAETL